MIRNETIGIMAGIKKKRNTEYRPPWSEYNAYKIL